MKNCLWACWKYLQGLSDWRNTSSVGCFILWDWSFYFADRMAFPPSINSTVQMLDLHSFIFFILTPFAHFSLSLSCADTQTHTDSSDVSDPLQIKWWLVRNHCHIVNTGHKIIDSFLKWVTSVFILLFSPLLTPLPLSLLHLQADKRQHTHTHTHSKGRSIHLWPEGRGVAPPSSSSDSRPSASSWPLDSCCALCWGRETSNLDPPWIWSVGGEERRRQNVCPQRENRGCFTTAAGATSLHVFVW